MKKFWIIALAAVLLLGAAACGRKETSPTATLKADTTPEQMVKELSVRYDLPESMKLENTADLAALLQIKEKYLLQGYGRMAAPEDNPQQILLVQSAPGKVKQVTKALQKRLENVQQAFLEYPAAQRGRLITVGDYAILVIVTTEDMDGVEQQITGYFSGGEKG